MRTLIDYDYIESIYTHECTPDDLEEAFRYFREQSTTFVSFLEVCAYDGDPNALETVKEMFEHFSDMGRDVVIRRILGEYLPDKSMGDEMWKDVEAAIKEYRERY